jgi:hypothetical protein
METFIKTPIGQALAVFRDLATYKNDKQALLSIKEQVSNPNINLFGRDDLIKTVDYYIRKIEAKEKVA